METMVSTMDEIIERVWIVLQSAEYAEVMKGERYHNHIIIKDKHETYRWEDNPSREKEIMDWYGAKDLNELFENGAKKNQPLVRELYRCIGYSIFGYWEVFYWDWNNELADEWLAVVEEIIIEQKCARDSNIL